MKQFLKDIAVEAGRMSLQYRQRLSELKVIAKTDSQKDLVTEADGAIEEFITTEITRRYPDHAIFGEEQGHKAGNEYRWVIDPIDGTSSFLHGQPFYSVCIAVERAGEGVLAAVNAPALGELFEAEKGHGATCNGTRIRVSQRGQLLDCILGTGFACVRADLQHNNLPYFDEIVPQIRDVRRYGSAGIDLCYVACGRLDGFWELNLAPYDVAAGLLIALEAGGQCSDFGGLAEGIPAELVVSNGLIHDQLVGLLGGVKCSVLQGGS